LRKKKSKELAAVPFIHIPGNQRGERGSIIVMVAICMAAFMLMLGLCIDTSRIYMVRAELQNAADAAALSAARELNSGTTGIDAAVARANSTVLSSNNTQGFAKSGISIASIQFAVTLNGTYMSAADAKAPGTVTNIRYVQVTTQSASTPILFAVSVLGGSRSQTRQAVAGMSIGLNTVCDYFNIALAVDPTIPGYANYTFPTGTELVAHFVSASGSTITLGHMQFTILDTTWAPGNGADETRNATAGTNPRCIHLGDILQVNQTPSGNNAFAIADGTNTRFSCYEQPMACPNPPPDLNVSQSITLAQYLAGSPLTGPSCTPGQKERRLLLIPIIDTLTNANPANGVVVKQFRGFLIKRVLNNGKPNPACVSSDAVGDIALEYAGDDFVTTRGFYDSSSCTITNLSVAVLYK
jgi:Flp pilus assembly protein TadG